MRYRAVNAETMKLFVLPSESGLPNVMQVGNCYLVRNQPSSPDDRTDAEQHDFHLQDVSFRIGHELILQEFISFHLGSPRNFMVS